MRQAVPVNSHDALIRQRIQQCLARKHRSSTEPGTVPPLEARHLGGPRADFTGPFTLRGEKKKKAVLLTIVHTSQKKRLAKTVTLISLPVRAVLLTSPHPTRRWVGPFSFKAPVLVPNLPLPLPTPGISWTQSPMPQRRLVHGEWDPARGHADPETPGIPCLMPTRHPRSRSKS